MFGKWARSKRAERSEANDSLSEARRSARFFRATSIELVELIRAFVLTERNLASDRFLERLDRLRELLELAADDRAKRGGAPATRFVTRFAERQARDVAEVEGELRRIIGVVTDGLVSVTTRNDRFHHRVSEHLEALDDIQRLDDLRRLRTRLAGEIDRIREAWYEVQAGDRGELDGLTAEVDSLREKLAQAEVESQFDALTGVHNRRALDRKLAHWVLRCRKHGARFALVMMDLDGFKQINDSEGHVVGDRTLAAVAGLCAAAVRSSDFMARYGGDEFVFLLEGASSSNARKAAAKLAELVRGTRFALADDPSAGYLELSASFGVATCRGDDTPATLLERADQALYARKREAGGAPRVGVA